MDRFMRLAAYWIQHEIVIQAVGGLESLYGMIAVNALVALGALRTFAILGKKL